MKHIAAMNANAIHFIVSLLQYCIAGKISMYSIHVNNIICAIEIAHFCLAFERKKYILSDAEDILVAILDSRFRGKDNDVIPAKAGIHIQGQA